jgi:putative ABC transport system permease protein
MMSRLGFWLRWSWRDLRRRWVLVIAIALVIAIGTGLYAGLGSMEDWRIASNDASFSALNSHDLEVTLSEGGQASPGALRRTVRSLPDRAAVSGLEERLIVPTQVEVRAPGNPRVPAPGLIVGSPLGASGPRIDGVAAASGRGLTSSDNGRPVAVLDASFGGYHDLPASGHLVLSGGERLRYVGQGRSPEYFLVTRPGGGDFGGAESSFAVIFTSLETAQRLAPGPPSVNDAVLTLRQGASPGGIRRGLESALARRSIGADVTTLAEEPSHRILYQDAHGDQELMNIFAILILAGAAFAAFNLSTRIVEAQRREIGVGMALGVPPRELAIRPLLLGGEIALAGTVLGLVLGLLAGDLMRGVLESLLPLPVMKTPFEPAIYVRGALLGFLLPVAATAIPVWRGLRVSPIEAIRVGFRSAKSSGLASLGKRLHLPGSSLAQMPVRNFLRAPRRSVMTVLGIAAVVAVVVALLGFIDSFLVTVDRSRAEVAGTTPNRLTVALDDFHARTSPVVRRIESAPGVKAAEARIDLPGALSSASGHIDASLELLNSRSRIWTPTITNGPGLTGRRPGIVIAEKAADDLGVTVGDTITVTHPQRTGRGQVTQARSEVPVVGTHPNPFRSFAYLSSGMAGRWGLRGMSNELAVAPRPGSGGEIERALFQLPAVAGVERATATTDFVRERMDDFVGVLRFTEIFALILTLLIAFNSTSISADERSRETATMLAFGVPAGETVVLSVFEAVITGVLGTLLGLLLGFLIVGWVVSTTLPRTLPDLGVIISISPESIAIAAVVGVIAVSVAPLLTARRVRRMDVSSTLRVVE